MAGVLKYLNVELRLAADNFNNGLRNSQKEMKEFQKTIKPSTDLLKDLGSAAKTAGTALTVAVTAPIAAAAGLGIAFNAMQEQAHIAFTTMLGDGQKASAFLNDLKDFAAKTPFEFPDLVRGAQRLMAMGFAAKDVKPLLTAVGNAVAGLGGGAAEIDRVTLALGQMAGRGKVATQEMNQLTEVGIPAWKILADKFGIAESKLRDLVEKGLIPADKAVKALTEGMNEKFGGMLEAQSKTFTGLISTIKDESRFLAGELTEGLFNAIKGPAETVAGFLHQLRLEMGGWSDSTKAAITITAGLTAALGPALFIFGQLAQSVVSLVSVYGTLKTAVTGLNLVLGVSFGPAGLIVAGAAALTAAAIVFFRYRDAIQSTRQQLQGMRVDVNDVRTAGERLQTVQEELQKSDSRHKVSIEGLSALMKQAREESERTERTQSASAMASGNLAASNQKLSGSLAFLNSQFKEITLAGDEQHKTTLTLTEDTNTYEKALAKMREMLTGDTTDMRALNQVIAESVAAGKPLEVLIERLGSAALTSAEHWREMGKAIPEATQQLALTKIFFEANIDLVRGLEYAVDETGHRIVQMSLESRESIAKMSLSLSNDLANAAKKAEKALLDLTDAQIWRQRGREMQEAFGDPLEKFKQPIDIPAPRLPIPSEGAINRGIQDAQRARQNVVDTIAAMEEMRRTGYTTAQIIAVLGSDLDKAARDAKVFGIEIDKSTIRIIEQQKRAEEWRQVWSHAMGEVVHDFVKGLTDIIFEGGSFAKKFAAIGKQTAKSFTEAFLLQLTSPLTNAMSNLGKTLADGLSKHLGDIFGASTGQGGGIFGAVGGGIFGGMTKQTPNVLNQGAAIPSIPAPGGGAAASGGGAFSGLGTGLISGGIAAAGSIIGSLRLEGTMNAVEHNTRYSMIYLETMINDFFHPWSSTFDWLLTHAGTHTNQLDAIYNVLTERVMGPMGMPMLAADAPNGGNFIVNMNVTAPISVVEKIDRQSVREEVMPEWIEAFETNISGYRAKIVEIVKNTMDGVVATRNPV